MTLTKTLSKTFAAAALLGVATLAPLGAAAAADGTKTKISATSYGEEITVTVPMAILDAEGGAEKLYKALENRAEKSCKITIPKRTGQSVSVKRCKADLMEDFISELDHETLTALHSKA